MVAMCALCVQVRPGVMPRLEQGWYHALVDPTSGCDVCLLAHTPSSTSSTRITMVYIPPEHRGRGHDAAAGAPHTYSVFVWQGLWK
jgi:hypothetical protein